MSERRTAESLSLTICAAHYWVHAKNIPLIGIADETERSRYECNRKSDPRRANAASGPSRPSINFVRLGLPRPISTLCSLVFGVRIGVSSTQ